MKYVNELIEELVSQKPSDSTEVMVNGVEVIGCSWGSKDVINILVPHASDFEDTGCSIDVETKDLEDEIDELKYNLENAADRCEDLIYNVNMMKHQFETYSKQNPEVWNKLKEIDRDDLIDFVKTAIDWYNIEERITEIADYN